MFILIYDGAYTCLEVKLSQVHAGPKTKVDTHIYRVTKSKKRKGQVNMVVLS